LSALSPKLCHRDFLEVECTVTETRLSALSPKLPALILEGVSKVSGFAAAGFKAADGNMVGASISVGTTFVGGKIGAAVERAAAKGVANGTIGAARARALGVGASLDSKLNEKMFGC
jgi:hypothetical protein